MPKGQLGLMIIPDLLDTEAFRAAWEQWLDDRRERRLPKYTARAQTMQLNRLAEMGPAAAIAAIEWSIAQGYKGIFPPPAAATPKPAKRSTWEQKTRIEAVEARIKQLKSKAPGEHCDLRDFLSRDEFSELKALSKQLKTLQKDIINA